METHHTSLQLMNDSPDGYGDRSRIRTVTI